MSRVSYYLLAFQHWLSFTVIIHKVSKNELMSIWVRWTHLEAHDELLDQDLQSFDLRSNSSIVMHRFNTEHSYDYSCLIKLRSNNKILTQTPLNTRPRF